MEVQSQFKNIVGLTKNQKKFYLTCQPQNLRKTLKGDSKKKACKHLGPYWGKNDPF